MDVIPRIRAARWADKEPVAALIADALHSGPLAQWLVPDPTCRQRILTDVAVIWVEHAMFFGDIQITDDLSAAAMGFHRYRSIPPPSNYHSRLADAAGPHARQFELLDHILTQVRPTEPHYHLAVLAVLPAARQRGTGAAMLTHHESRVDRIDMPSWTEIAPDSQDLYRGHGYLPRPALTLPDGPVLVPMGRNPHPNRGSWPLNTARPATVTAAARAQSDAQR